MRLEKNDIDNLKEKIIDIMNELKLYYQENYKNWDEENTNIFNQMIGTIIITSKKIESIEKTIVNISQFQKGMSELLDIELEEVEIIVSFYYETFVNKKGV